MSVTVDDVIVAREGTTIHLRAGDERASVVVDAIGDAAVTAAIDAVDARLATGAPLADAINAAASIRDIPRRCERRVTPSGLLVLDDRDAVTAADVRRSLQVVAGLTRGSDARSFVVAGELVTDPADWFEDHDALGRVVVRLDIAQLIVIGHGARHLHNAAGLEGSWDGESLLVETPDEAYASLHDRVHSGDVVLVTGGGVTDLSALVDRLMEATA